MLTAIAALMTVSAAILSVQDTKRRAMWLCFAGAGVGMLAVDAWRMWGA